MAICELGATRIHYEIEGSGYPVLLIAPGGMSSANDVWLRFPWNPRSALAADYQVIGMDQRNSGSSSGPVAAGDGWATFTADQLGLLDALGVEECHVVGSCIGGSYILALLATAPERFRSAVMLQPIGIGENRSLFYDAFDAWAEALAPRHPEAGPDDWRALREALWSGDFVCSVDREQIRACTTPTLLLMGNDVYHPEPTSRELAELLPNCELIEQWKEEEFLADTDAAIKRFLSAHTPAEVR
jgi:pimeloyl-ACP methyl ester carboxylesterase